MPSASSITQELPMATFVCAAASVISASAKRSTSNNLAAPAEGGKKGLSKGLWKDAERSLDNGTKVYYNRCQEFI
jgi:hypothetical protein